MEEQTEIPQHIPVKEETHCGKQRHPVARRSHSTTVISQQLYRLLHKLELTALICEERGNSTFYSPK